MSYFLDEKAIFVFGSLICSLTTHVKINKYLIIQKRSIQKMLEIKCHSIHLSPKIDKAKIKEVKRLYSDPKLNILNHRQTHKPALIVKNKYNS